VLQRFDRLWHESYRPEQVRIVREDAGAELYRQLGERCLSNYYRRHYPFDADETLAVEARVGCELGAGGYRIRGVIDRLVRARDGAIEIHDYKTSRRVPSQQTLDRDRQLGLYQLALAERFGEEQPVRLVWHYLLPNQTRTSTRTREELVALREETKALIDRIRGETGFAPRPGPLCRWCEYADRCPASPVHARPPEPSAAVDAALPVPLGADATGQLQLL
jgi:putative RecB family exonuclease